MNRTVKRDRPIPPFPVNTPVRAAAMAAARLEGKDPAKALTDAFWAQFHAETKGVDLKRLQYELNLENRRPWNSTQKDWPWEFEIKHIMRTKQNYTGRLKQFIACRGGRYRQDSRTGDFNWKLIREKLEAQAAWLADEKWRREQAEEHKQYAEAVRNALCEEFKDRGPYTSISARGGERVTVSVSVANLNDGKALLHAIKELGLL